MLLESLVFLIVVLLLVLYLYIRRRQLRLKQSTYVVAFDSKDDFSGGTLSETTQPSYLVNIDDEECFSIDYDEEDDKEYDEGC